MKKCTKCNADFELSQNLQGYSPVDIIQMEFCPKCISQVVNIRAANDIIKFNDNLRKEKQNEKTFPWKEIVSWTKSILQKEKKIKGNKS